MPGQEVDPTPISQGIKHGPHNVDLPYQPDTYPDSPFIDENAVAMNRANINEAVEALERGHADPQNVTRVRNANKLAIGQEQNRALKAAAEARAEAYGRGDARASQY